MKKCQHLRNSSHGTNCAQANSAPGDSGASLGRPAQVGQIDAIMINRPYINRTHKDLYSVLNESVELHELEDLWGILSDLESSGGEEGRGKALYIKRLYISPGHKGLGLGLYMIDSIDTIFNGNDSLCLIKPFPLQYEGRDRSDNNLMKGDCDGSIGQSLGASSCDKSDDSSLNQCNMSVNSSENSAEVGLHSSNILNDLAPLPPRPPDGNHATSEHMVETFSDLPNSDDLLQTSLQKVTNYYSKLGFEPFRDGYMVRWNGRAQPRLSLAMGLNLEQEQSVQAAD